jgi:non-ribosomal peptide synthetase component E (peptide arylation enzyme)
VFFSLELIGAVANKVNPDFRSRELDYILKFSNSRAVVCPREFKGFDYVAMAKSLQASIPGLTHVIISGGAPEGTFDRQGYCEQSPARCRAPRAHGPERGVPHGVHIRDDRRSKMRPT